MRVLLSTYNSRGGVEPLLESGGGVEPLLEPVSRGKPPVPAELMP